jgi:hypothetical protein
MEIYPEEEISNFLQALVTNGHDEYMTNFETSVCHISLWLAGTRFESRGADRPSVPAAVYR